MLPDLLFDVCFVDQCFSFSPSSFGLDHLDKVISLKLVYYCATIIISYCFILAVKVKKENVFSRFAQKACL
jgi:hypothetical protein